MKSIGALIIITTLAFIAVAQRAQNNTDEALKARNAPDVFVYTASAIGSDGKRSSSFTIEVGNNGTKGISAISSKYFHQSPDKLPPTEGGVGGVGLTVGEDVGEAEAVPPPPGEEVAIGVGEELLDTEGVG